MFAVVHSWNTTYTEYAKKRHLVKGFIFKSKNFKNFFHSIEAELQ